MQPLGGRKINLISSPPFPSGGLRRNRFVFGVAPFADNPTVRWTIGFSLMHPLPPTRAPGVPPTALAPMQDVTTLPFMEVISRYGAPDYFFTEYFRVYATSTPEPFIIRSLEALGPEHPIFAQIIGEHIPAIERTIRQLSIYPIAGIDLNLGCPAPKVYKKNVGGGLLRDPERIDAILSAMRAATTGRLTVKMRLGFEDADSFPRLLETVARHDVDLVSIHGRTVKQMYRGEVDYERIGFAKSILKCPVLANGNVSSVARARDVLDQTEVDGLMIGRGAIRNPWIFRQIREHFTGVPVFEPRLGDLRHYVDALWQAFFNPEVPDRLQTNFLKKFLNFIGQSVDPGGEFLRAMRRAQSSSELFAICDAWMIAGERETLTVPPEPYPGIVARPNHESTPEPASCGL